VHREWKMKNRELAAWSRMQAPVLNELEGVSALHMENEEPRKLYEEVRDRVR
jgi:hypothetical protein